MSLHLLRFDPDLLRCQTWFRQEHLLNRDVEDEGYAWHALLTAAFGRDLAPKPFRVLGRRGRPPQLLAYSAHDGATLAAHADAFCDPLAHQALNIATLAGKPMPAFAAGRRLGFEVRVRPVVRTDGPGGRDSVAERDAYVAACARAGAGPRPDPADVFADWTQARLAAGGAEVAAIRLDAIAGDKVLRRGAPGSGGGRPLVAISGHSAVLVGTLSVRDAEAFGVLLARGVGRHRAFGYGMLLLSPPEA
ncbi:type I-E CRISPR-associated protein Cas6/Cse3/CasE [Xanthobacter agilis]|uniref:CRISPR system Cascade subunit CasE n=1 Tax=Xanthobacter agilis TaxID=47492 RepID=A0ABU0LJF6_XANAG|nr:type I-E CRISPR-associated protein Cas6/Cse3/CasE [Xanthobacter agilis]MDQ0507277.1 CRISPR system Cascade subunit CasE [Xanthobacter agilis]